MPKLNKVKRIIAFVLLFVGLVFVLLLILAPPIAKNYINKNGAELVGRNLSINKLKLNYFTSTLRVIDFKMFEENGSDAFIGFDTLLVDLKPLRLLKHELNVEQLLVVNLSAQVIQNDTVFNFTDLVEFFATEDSTLVEDEAADEEPYRLNLNQLEFKSGGLSYTDLEVSSSVMFKDISFRIPHIYWGEQEKSAADVHFNLGRGGSFSSSAAYDTETGEFEGDVKVSGLELSGFLPYLQEYMDVSDLQGTLSTEVTFAGNENEIEGLSITSNSRVENLKIADNQGKTVLGLAGANVVLKEAKPLQYYIEIDTVQLDDSYIYFALMDSVTNFEKMIVPQTYAEESTAVDEESEHELSIIMNRFIINNGLLDFSDQSLYQVFDYELSEVAVNMDTISLHDDWINVDATMKLNKRGSLKAKLGVNPMDPLDKISVEYVISDFQLPDVNIYSKHYAGLPILFGDMYYVGNTTIANKQLISNNELIIRNVEMGRKTGGLYDVPIKLAMFILKDINGDIVLDVPVTGDLSDPQTRVGTIVWNTFKGFVFKIVASPFKAFGNLLSAEPKDLEELSLNYGDTLLLAKQEKNLDLLLELENLKPEIKIEMQYLNDKKLERTDVAAGLLQDSFYQKYNKNAGNHRKAYLSFLEETSGRDSMLIQDYELLLAPSEVVDSIVIAREVLRLKLVSNYFTAKNDSSTIEVLDYNSSDVLNIGSRPRFLVKYLLAEDAVPND